MKNFSKRSIRRDGTTSTAFVVPAGVKSLKISFIEKFTAKNGSFSQNKLIDEYGRVWSWGINSAGQVGDGTITNRISPVQLLGQIWKAPFIRADGQMVNMGSNSNGQIGDGTTINRSTPTLVLGGYRFKKIARGSTCFGLAEDGKLYAWGRNAHGQLGDGTTADKSSPVQVMPGTTFVDFWTDSGFNADTDGVFNHNVVYAKDSSNQTWAWGRDAGGYGQLGIGAVGSVSTPTLVVGGFNFIKISTSGQPSLGGFALGLTDTGAVYGWGYNAAGQLGDNTIVSKSTPTLVVGGYSFADVVGGVEHGMGLTKDGVVYTWGNNGDGQLGQGNIFPKSSPVTVSGLTAGCKRIACTGSSNYVIDANSRLYAWGSQTVAAPILGTGDNAKRSTPNLLSTIGVYEVVEEIVEPMAAQQIAIVTKFNTRYAWGNNQGAAGTLGANLAGGTYSIPQQVIGPVPIAQPTITGNLWHKRSKEKIESYTVDVSPGQAITISHQASGFVIPELGLASSSVTEQVDLEWLG